MTPIDKVYASITDAPWLRRNTLLMTKVGSHAYNLAGPSSDVDRTGVAYPEPEMAPGLKPSFQQRSTKAPNPDCTIFELRKFLSCALDGNPAFLDPLFCRDEDAVRSETSIMGWNLRSLRQSFLSQKMTNAYLGYAQSQIKRFVNGKATGGLNYKSGMHAIRACRVLRRAHSEGVVEVYRGGDRDELIAIRSGTMTQEAVLRLAAYEEQLAKDAEKRSVLPKEPDDATVNDWCMDTLRIWVMG